MPNGMCVSGLRLVIDVGLLPGNIVGTGADIGGRQGRGSGNGADRHRIVVAALFVEIEQSGEPVDGARLPNQLQFVGDLMLMFDAQCGERRERLRRRKARVDERVTVKVVEAYSLAFR